jgi:hypothetical protein
MQSAEDGNRKEEWTNKYLERCKDFSARCAPGGDSRSNSGNRGWSSGTSNFGEPGYTNSTYAGDNIGDYFIAQCFQRKPKLNIVKRTKIIKPDGTSIDFYPKDGADVPQLQDNEKTRNEFVLVHGSEKPDTTNGRDIICGAILYLRDSKHVTHSKEAPNEELNNFKNLITPSSVKQSIQGKPPPVEYSQQQNSGYNYEYERYDYDDYSYSPRSQRNPNRGAYPEQANTRGGGFNRQFTRPRGGQRGGWSRYNDGY